MTRPRTETVRAYEKHRASLEGLAYRMTGSISEAEDIVQEAFLRMHRARPGSIDEPRAWLNTVVARLALDRLRANRRRRRSYDGPWLPEPVPTDEGGRPDMVLEHADSISIAFLVLLEALSPLERAAYLLHDIFDYDHAEVGAILDRSPAACRQLASRARRRLRTARPASAVAPADRESVQRFVSAIRRGNLGDLVAQLKEDVTLVSDGGGKAPAATRPIVGAERVARFLIGLARKYEHVMRVEERDINGRPGLVSIDATSGRVLAAMTVELSEKRISAIRTIVNPDKLGALAQDN